jgi:hypothetical protein
MKMRAQAVPFLRIINSASQSISIRQMEIISGSGMRRAQILHSAYAFPTSQMIVRIWHSPAARLVKRKNVRRKESNQHVRALLHLIQTLDRIHRHQSRLHKALQQAAQITPLRIRTIRRNNNIVW